ncbi:acyltransferase-domain-containing protein [Aulographum hederae CBS 113979]|uniref:1-acyl-sn-glycerol-3-phosphate acyltransferase n=1 Tax=Aulographum hederae CBS 113979 TaxID=1176131 RepID=A0A6G1H6Y9_9PEZI|nr:acyltransferase-domain-containing protein [Aulographum hederae CBS 113979]
MPPFSSLLLYFLGLYFANTLLLYALAWVTYPPKPARSSGKTTVKFNGDVNSITDAFPEISTTYRKRLDISLRCGFCARLLASWAAFFTCAAYGVLAAFVLRVTGFGGLSQWTVARSFKYSMGLFAGVWFDVVEGQEYLDNTRPAVIIGNHQTELDVLMLGAIFPKYTSVTAKSSLRFVPLLGQFMMLSKTVFINRSDRKNALAAFDSAAKTMRNQKQNVYIFPEGTRSYSNSPELLPFKKGAFHLAVQAQVPIIPVVVANYADILNLKTKVFRAGHIPVKVLKPVSTEGLETKDVEELCRRIRQDMLETLVELTEEHRGRGKGKAQYAAREVKAMDDGSKGVKKEL